jgi:hypothetical protein
MNDVPKGESAKGAAGSQEAREKAAYNAALRQPSRSTAKTVGIILIILGVSAAVMFGLFVWLVSSMGSPGRPLRVLGVRVRPSVTRRKRAALPFDPEGPDTTRVAPHLRRRLAKGWLDDARAEHASVAAFERLAMDLTRAGAPDALAAWARRAALEEVGHATMCFAVASAYAAQEFSASSRLFVLPWRARRESRSALIERLAVESLLDGCIEEGCAAKSASLAARRAVDPALAKVLSRIALEEASHAELAYAIVAWAVEEEPAILPRLEAALSRSRARTHRPSPRDAELVAFGRLAPTDVELLERETRQHAEQHIAGLLRGHRSALPSAAA